MLNALRLAILAWLLAGLLAIGDGRAEDVDTAAPRAEPSDEPATTPDRDAGVDVDAFLEPWRRVRVARLIPDHAHACVPVVARLPATTVPSEIGTYLDLVAKSPLGAWLVGQATRRMVLVCHDPNTHFAAYYRAQVRLIGLLARLPEAAKIMFLAHELAHVLQHPRYSNDRRFGPQAMLLMHRMREATAEALATRVLWQLRERSYPELWEHKLQSAYGDIASVFAQAMADRRGEFAELRATRAAFDQWFERPERLRQYDDHMLNHLERLLRDRRGLRPPRRILTDDFLRGIGWHAGATFLAKGTGRALTDADYAGGLSADNAARLDTVLRHAAPPPKVSLQDGATFR